MNENGSKIIFASHFDFYVICSTFELLALLILFDDRNHLGGKAQTSVFNLIMELRAINT